MEQWEYLKVECGYHDHLERVHWINDAELPNWKGGPAVSEYVNSLGAVGWEMTGMSSWAVSMALVPARLIWFKRRCA